MGSGWGTIEGYIYVNVMYAESEWWVHGHLSASLRICWMFEMFHLTRTQVFQELLDLTWNDFQVM